MKVLYFAYGPNLNQEQMLQRCPNAKIYDFGVLTDYELVFCGHSRKRKGGVASVEPSNDSYVEGIVYLLDFQDVKDLDRAEGYPISYQRTSARVITSGGKEVSALLYFKEENKEPSDPHPDYVQIIAEAYGRYGFNHENLLNAII